MLAKVAEDFGVDEEVKCGAAVEAVVLVEVLAVGKQGKSGLLPLQLLLHLAACRGLLAIWLL